MLGKQQPLRILFLSHHACYWAAVTVTKFNFLLWHREQSETLCFVIACHVIDRALAGMSLFHRTTCHRCLLLHGDLLWVGRMNDSSFRFAKDDVPEESELFLYCGESAETAFFPKDCHDRDYALNTEWLDVYEVRILSAEVAKQ